MYFRRDTWCFFPVARFARWGGVLRTQPSHPSRVPVARKSLKINVRIQYSYGYLLRTFKRDVLQRIGENQK